MSAAVTTETTGQGRNLPSGVRALFVVTDVCVPVILAIGVAQHWSYVRSHFGTLALWMVTAAVADSLFVPFWSNVFLTMSLPVTVAAAMLLDPPIAGLVAFTGAFDPREFNRDIGFNHAIYNRCQVAVSVMLCSILFHELGGDPLAYPDVLVVAVLALILDALANTSLVMVPVGLMQGVSPLQAARRVYGSTWPYHLGGYVALGFLGLSLATVVAAVGSWGLAVVLIPIAAVRQMFIQARRAEESGSALESKDRALVAASASVADERRDERLTVAGELHDEVLPPLFKVHLMGQVLRQDLTSGRLLDLDDDLPELLSATEAAQDAIRGVVRNLRHSSLGPGGLSGTLKLLARQLESTGSPPIELQLDDVQGTHAMQLLAYQVAREAMNNAARHSLASRISVFLSIESGLIRLVVEDDGVGFDRTKVDTGSHFGLQLISERVAAAGGRVVVDTHPGEGVRISVALPMEEWS